MRTARKAQAAMEFLMTYGWAILVVLAAIAALAYFGVLSPGKYLPESCVLESGISCDHKITAESAILVLQNGMGKDITITSIDVAGCAGSALSQDLNTGTKGTFTITGCTNGAAGDRFSGDITIGYTEKDSGLTKTTTGRISTKIQP